MCSTSPGRLRRTAIQRDEFSPTVLWYGAVLPRRLPCLKRLGLARPHDTVGAPNPRSTVCDGTVCGFDGRVVEVDAVGWFSACSAACVELVRTSPERERPVQYRTGPVSAGSGLGCQTSAVSPVEDWGSGSVGCRSASGVSTDSATTAVCSAGTSSAVAHPAVNNPATAATPNICLIACRPVFVGPEADRQRNVSLLIITRNRQ